MASLTLFYALDALYLLLFLGSVAGNSFSAHGAKVQSILLRLLGAFSWEHASEWASLVPLELVVLMSASGAAWPTAVSAARLNRVLRMVPVSGAAEAQN